MSLPLPEPHRLHGRSQEVYDALRNAGIIHEGDHVRRVIIDIDVETAVVCYIERYPDSRMLDLLPVLGSAEIRWAPKPEAAPAACDEEAVHGPGCTCKDSPASFVERGRWS
jgi:hypothetical protein